VANLHLLLVVLAARDVQPELIGGPEAALPDAARSHEAVENDADGCRQMRDLINPERERAGSGIVTLLLFFFEHGVRVHRHYKLVSWSVTPYFRVRPAFDSFYTIHKAWS
jgi:hypothetical protein